MTHLARLRLTRGRTMLARAPAFPYLCSSAELSHRASSYRGMLVRAHMRACGSLEHQSQVSRTGWHLKVHS